MKNQSVQATESEVQFFASEKASGTLDGAIKNNPAAAVRALGPFAVIAEMCKLSPEDQRIADEYEASLNA